LVLELIKTIYDQKHGRELEARFYLKENTSVISARVKLHKFITLDIQEQF